MRTTLESVDGDSDAELSDVVDMKTAENLKPKSNILGRHKCESMVERNLF